MTYKTSVEVNFECDRQAAYDALCYLGRYPEWNQGMIYISHTGPMYAGLKYQTRSRVLGQTNAAEVVVVNLVPGELVHLKSDSGLITFNAVFLLADREGGGSTVTCRLAFEFHQAVLNLARGVIEDMANDRLRRDLTKLSGILLSEKVRGWFR